jgi:septum formation protein
MGFGLMAYSHKAQMKPIILASNSPQRKKLLQVLGLKFKVVPSNAEEIEKILTTPQAMVIGNARIKARHVARRLKKGVVIGADTTVFIGNKMTIGKPKDYKDARRILKVLFSRPHWVYTGVCVIDVAKNKEIVGYEKTKVFMIHLTDQEIKNYHSKMNPLDKAGGFDIEGWGSVFIHRIEGCYSNVIGLPMAKLASMLKKVGVNIL